MVRKQYLGLREQLVQRSRGEKRQGVLRTPQKISMAGKPSVLDHVASPLQTGNRGMGRTPVYHTFVATWP